MIQTAQLTTQRAAPRTWAWLTWAVLAFAAAHLVANGVTAVLYGLSRQATAEALSKAAGGTVPSLDRIGDLQAGLDLLSVVLVALTVAGLAILIAWAVVVRRLVRRYGGDPVLNHRAIKVAVLLLPVLGFLASTGYLASLDDAYVYEVSEVDRGVDLTLLWAAVVRMLIAVTIALWAWAVRGRVAAVLAAEPGGPPVVALPPGARGGLNRWRRSRQERVYR
jgi:hypothetical protein